MSTEAQRVSFSAIPTPVIREGVRVHLVGIGGSGMSGAASLLLAMGAEVSGSDSQPFPGMGSLVEQGARIHIGHAASLVDPEVELLVRSAAVPENNAEVLAARALGVRVLKYAELLGAIMAARSGVAVAGTHGKSTTTAMTAHLFRRAGLDPSFVVGARSPQLGGSSGFGQGRHFIVEACEFDRSFLQFRPESAAILNIEPDHLDCFGDLSAIVDAFGRFAAQVEPCGTLICNHEDISARRAAESTRANVETFGFDPEADWRAFDLAREQGRYSFSVSFRGRFLLSTRLAIAGKHNVGNALAAIALALRAGAEPAAAAGGVADFAGVDRRMTLRGQARGVTILDDYAHHPTEIRATLEAAQGRYTPKRTWVIFQPHQYARTCSLMEDFAGSFALADAVIVPDIYGARESDAGCCRAGSEELVSRIRQAGRAAQYAPSLRDAAGQMMDNLEEGDLVLTMGAGDVWKVADELVERICRPNGP